jgi:hypothetical protein
MNPNVVDAVDRYCAGRMSEREQELFEIQLVADPGLAAEVELTRKMRAGLRELERRGELDGLAQSSPPATGRWFLAAAAVIMMSVGAILLYRWAGSSRGTLSIATSLAEVTRNPNSPPRVLGTYVLSSTRAQARSTQIAIPDGVGVIQLRALPDAPSAPAEYRVELTDLQTGARTSRAPVSADAAGVVQVYLEVDAIRPGEYTLQVRPTDQTAGTNGDTSFRVQFSAPGR